MRIHFIGIGGIGLSALAKFLAKQGYEISGSDIAQSEITDDLALNYGIKINIPHHADAVEGADLVIHSAVVKPNNVEYKRAKELGIEVISRKEALKFILKDYEVYAVAGAHGKSTTSAILASIIPKSNALIGAISKEFGSNVRYYPNKKVVFEADESDASFLNSNPYLAIVTNVEKEHMEYYNYDEELFFNTYEKFINLAKLKVLNQDDPWLNQKKFDAIYLSPKDDIKNIEYQLIDDEPYISFELKDFGKFKVYGFGEHIALDASLAILAAVALGEDIEDIRKNILNYKGIKKRFDIIYKDEDVAIVDDYGHHPTEIKATLKALKKYMELKGLKNLHVIWQPHKYTRTIDNLSGFVEAFKGVDTLVILPIWAAGEIEIPIDLKGAFSSYNPIMADRIKREGNIVKVIKDSAPIEVFKKGLIVAFGAGDITYQIRGEK